MLARKTTMNIIKNIKNRENGQTLVETTFMLLLLLLILFAIAEFARAWFLKNSLNNAARVGARFAVVEVDLESCTVCAPDDADAVAQVLDAPGVPSGSGFDVTVDLDIFDKGSGAVKSEADTGDIVTVTVTVGFLDSEGESTTFSAFGRLIPGLSTLSSLSAKASMRYEL